MTPLIILLSIAEIVIVIAAAAVLLMLAGKALQFLDEELWPWIIGWWRTRQRLNAFATRRKGGRNGV